MGIFHLFRKKKSEHLISENNEEMSYRYFKQTFCYVPIGGIIYYKDKYYIKDDDYYLLPLSYGDFIWLRCAPTSIVDYAGEVSIMLLNQQRAILREVSYEMAEY